MRLRQVRKNYNKWLDKADKLKHWVLEQFDSDKQHQLFADSVYGEEFDVESWLESLSPEIVEHG